MGWTKVDRSRGKREEYFRHYYEDVPCFYSMTVPLDVTRLRAAGLRLYPAMLYLLSRAVNRHEEFRCALVNGEVGVYDALSPSYTVFHKETETFSNLWTEYFSPKPGEPDNLFTVSMLPWASFEGFHLHLPRGNDYLLPIFTMGKLFAREGKTWLPLALQVHHSVCDGFHACRLVNEVQAMLDAPEAWSGPQS